MSDTATTAAATTTTAAPPDWRASLPDDLKTNPSLTTIPDVNTLAKVYVDTKALTGRKAYDVPQPDWKAEQWTAWNKTIGVPDAPDKYTPVPKEALDKAGLPPEVISTATAKMHEYGLTDRQAKGLLDWYLGDTVKGQELQAKATADERAQGESILRGEFKDKYDANMGLVKAWIAQNATPGFAEAVEKAGLGSNPEFVRAIVKSAASTLEASGRGGQASSMGSDGARAQAANELEAMKGDKVQMDKYFAGDKEMRAKWDRLQILKAGGVSL